MIGYIIRRLLSTLLLLFGVATLVFIILHTLPGDPTSVFLSPRVPPQVIERLKVEFGLDQPLTVQYWNWLKGILHGELGFSFTHQKDVLEIVFEAFGNTASLAIVALLIEITIGILAGWIAARYENSWIDKVISYAALSFYTVPVFWVATILLLLFSYFTGILPSSQMHSIGAEQLSSLDYIMDFFSHVILPASTLGIAGAAGLSLFVRSQLSSIMREQYITVARSFGLTESKVLVRYALPNALLPVITVVGMELGGLMSGVLITETMFAWPGLGRMTVSAIFARDYPLVIGCTMIAGAAVVVGNLLADILYCLADPRIRIES
jgi:peptide/nickel transport system permease protein